MADELLLSMGDTEGIDYTMKEYMKLVAKTQACVDRLNEQGENIFFTYSYLTLSIRRQLDAAQGGTGGVDPLCGARHQAGDLGGHALQARPQGGQVPQHHRDSCL